MVAYLGYTLRMRTLFRGWPIMVNDTHTRRRRCSFCPRRRNWDFSKFNMAAAAMLNYCISEFGTFCHDGCLFLDLYQNWFVQVMSYNRLKRPTFVPDVPLMTSCELSFGSIFGQVAICARSCCICVTRFIQNILMQYGNISIVGNSI